MSTPIIHRALFEIEIGESTTPNSENKCDEGYIGMVDASFLGLYLARTK